MNDEQKQRDEIANIAAEIFVRIRANAESATTSNSDVTRVAFNAAIIFHKRRITKITAIDNHLIR